MRKVVVTGGAGFIGSHLAKELTRRGYEVIILDDLSSGRMKNITGLTKTRNPTEMNNTLRFDMAVT